MDIKELEGWLDSGLKIVEQAAPLASAFGPAAGAWGQVIANIAGTADHLVAAVEADAEIIGSGDTTRIKALQAQLQQQNKALSARVDES